MQGHTWGVGSRGRQAGLPEGFRQLSDSIALRDGTCGWLRCGPREVGGGRACSQPSGGAELPAPRVCVSTRDMVVKQCH